GLNFRPITRGLNRSRRSTRFSLSRTTWGISFWKALPALARVLSPQPWRWDDAWHGLNAARMLVQTCGRSVRSINDQTTTHVLDADWPRFMARNHRFLPHYFLETLRPFSVLTTNSRLP